MHVSFKSDKNSGQYFTWRQIYFFFFIIARLFLLSMRNVSDKSCSENKNIHFLFSGYIFPPKILPFMR